MSLGTCEDCGVEDATGYCIHCGREFCAACSDKETCWKGFHTGSF